MGANDATIQRGVRLMNLLIGAEIGKGAFGRVYSAIDIESGVIWAVKTELTTSRRKTLMFEYEVLTQIQSVPYVPRVGGCGITREFQFYIMEYLGPSLIAVIRRLGTRLSMSSAIRTAYHTLKAIESVHRCGCVHRDIKPGNFLTREGFDTPLVLVDFGLSRIYVDARSGGHLPQRPRVGFRGTRAYASVGAHRCRDMSRRDDVTSWFFMIVEILPPPLGGDLPWRSCPREEVLRLKEQFVPPPRLRELWDLICALGWEDEPPYAAMYGFLQQRMGEWGIGMQDPFDWSEDVRDQRRRTVWDLDSISESSRIAAQWQPMRERIDTAPLLGPYVSEQPPFSRLEGEPGCCGCC